MTSEEPGNKTTVDIYDSANATVPRNMFKYNMFEDISNQLDKWSILGNYLDTEKNYLGSKNFVQPSKNVNCRLMRPQAIDLLVKLTEQYHLGTEVLYLSVAYMDRYLTLQNVSKANLKLLAITSIFIAMKFEQSFYLKINCFCNLMNFAYSKRQMLMMEKKILKVLDFQLNIPTNYVFICSFAAVSNEITERVKNLSLYISELSLLEFDSFLDHPPSQIAAACIALARVHLDAPIWSIDLQKITTYEILALKEVFLKLSELFNRSESLKFKVISSKYKMFKYLCVADIQPFAANSSCFISLTEMNP